jgi:N-acetylglutamate synthase
MSAAAAAPPSVAALERASHSAVPAARVAFDGPFVIRAFLASSLDPASDPELPARQARIAAHYARLGLPARFRSTPLDPPGLDALLRVRGFAERDETCVLAGPLDAFAAADDEVEALDGPTEAWLSVVATADYQTEARREEKTRAPAMLVPPAAWMLLRARSGVSAASVLSWRMGPWRASSTSRCTPNSGGRAWPGA